MPFDPRLIAIFCLVFIVLGVFSIVNGRKRLLEAQAQGQKIAWYRHISILTGIEYILLALTFLTSISINAGWLPKSWTAFLDPFLPDYAPCITCTGLYCDLSGISLATSRPASSSNGQ